MIDGYILKKRLEYNSARRHKDWCKNLPSNQAAAAAYGMKQLSIDTDLTLVISSLQALGEMRPGVCLAKRNEQLILAQVERGILCMRVVTRPRKVRPHRGRLAGLRSDRQTADLCRALPALFYKTPRPSTGVNRIEAAVSRRGHGPLMTGCKSVVFLVYVDTKVSGRFASWNRASLLKPASVVRLRSGWQKRVSVRRVLLGQSLACLAGRERPGG